MPECSNKQRNQTGSLGDFCECNMNQTPITQCTWYILHTMHMVYPPHNPPFFRNFSLLYLIIFPITNHPRTNNQRLSSSHLLLTIITFPPRFKSVTIQTLRANVKPHRVQSCQLTLSPQQRPMRECKMNTPACQRHLSQISPTPTLRIFQMNKLSTARFGNEGSERHETT
jgi:hypothetical protein